MKPKTIRQTVSFKASPHKIYEMLMDSRIQTRFSGGKASISRRSGGKFTAYDNYISGTNIELVPDTKIVQSWRASDWPEGHYSKVTFTFKKIKDGCHLTFTQTGVPEQQYEGIRRGWHDFYWSPMKKLLEE